jgi:pimeloyl-ACP methyl ester carboxylesterase
MSTPLRFEHVTDGGVRLVGDAFGARAGAPVILLGGAGQTRQSWGGTAQRLGEAGFWAIAVDQRGHGESSWVEDGEYEMVCFVEDLIDLAESFARPPAVVGASLGGLAALIGSGWRRLRLDALVLVDIAPRIELGGARRVLEFMAAHPEGFESLEAAVEVIAGYLPGRDRQPTKAGLDRVLRADGDRWRWHWDPKVLGGIGLILEGDEVTAARRAAQVNEMLLDAARNIDVPTLLVRGRLSDVVTTEGAQEFLEAVPGAEFVDVTGAGHMVAGDRNDAFTDAVIDFLRRNHPPSRRNWTPSSLGFT